MNSLFKKIVPHSLHEPILRASDLWYRLRYGFSQPVVITDIFGVRSVLYPYTTMHIRWLLKRGMYTKEMCAMEKLISPESIVFDIGANVGIVSVLIAKRFATAGTIYAFEPLPATFKKLKLTLALNELDNVQPYNIAISNTNGTHDFYYNDDASSELNSLGKVSVDTALTQTMHKSVAVQTSTLDTFCTDHHISKIDFVKIDVEGFEYEVIQGMQNLLDSGSINYIQFEISQVPLKSLGKTSKPIFDLLKQYGYMCYSFSEATDRFQGPINDADSKYDNYYASRSSLA